jgi:hypothetical protein
MQIKISFQSLAEWKTSQLIQIKEEKITVIKRKMISNLII